MLSGETGWFSGNRQGLQFNLLRFPRMQRAEQEPSIRKAKDINTGLTNDLRALKKQNGTLNEEVEAAKKERSDLQEQLVST